MQYQQAGPICTTKPTRRSSYYYKGHLHSQWISAVALGRDRGRLQDKEETKGKIQLCIKNICRIT